MKISISRYNPERDKAPYLQHYEIALVADDHMLLDVLIRLKRQDDTAPAVAAGARRTGGTRTSSSARPA